MKKFSITAMLFAVWSLIACGGDNGDNSAVAPESRSEVSSKYELGVCNERNALDSIFVVKEKVLYFCNGLEWVNLDGNSQNAENNLSSSVSYSSAELNDYNSKKSSSASILSSSSKTDEDVLSSFIPASTEQDSAALAPGKIISGLAQKGPFINGSKIVIRGIDGENFKETGKAYRGNISSDNGQYSLSDVSITTQHAKFQVTGCYYNEVTGLNTSDPITLNAITDISNQETVNINLLTHLEYDRVLSLIKSGLDVNSAKLQVEKEICKLFYIDTINIEKFENLDIFGLKDSDAALLAMSILLQGDWHPSELVDFLKKINENFSNYGEWRDRYVSAAFADWALDAEDAGLFDTIRRNLNKFYPAVTVPDFEKHIRYYYSIESGLGVCDSDSIPVGTIKNVSNRASKYFTLSYATTRSKERFVCDYDETNKLRWRKATDIEKDTVGWGHNFVEGDVKNGQVNHDFIYVYQNGNWRKGATEDSIVGIGCIPSFEDSVVLGSDSVWYFCKSDTWNPIIFDTMIDDRGWSYKIAKFGSKWWMAENLRNPYPIEYGSMYYDSNIENCKKCGRLYTWAAAVDSAAFFSTTAKDCGNGKNCFSTLSTGKVRGNCPNGWHLPNIKEWEDLINTAGRIFLKPTKDIRDTSSYPFTTFLTGYAYNGKCYGVDSTTFFWSATEDKIETNMVAAVKIAVFENGWSIEPTINWYDYMSKSAAFSVRCVKD